MGNLIADIFVTIGGNQSPDRVAIINKSLDSLFASTEPGQARITLCLDGISRWATDPIGKIPDADYILSSKENEGLGPTINRAVTHIKMINDWYSHPTHGDQTKVAPYVCMTQDDVIYTTGWLPKLVGKFRAYGLQYKLGFASGIESIEHPIKKDLGGGVILKDWIRATNMIGERSYWESMMPIPRLDPETRQVRAKPNDGMGSGVDWHVIRNHENSVCRSGRTCLVMPGLLQHIGFKDSTWLQNGREMPESESDKEKMKDV